MSIVVVGSFGIDTVETPHGKVENSVGGSAIYFSLPLFKYFANSNSTFICNSDCIFHSG